MDEIINRKPIIKKLSKWLDCEYYRTNGGQDHSETGECISCCVQAIEDEPVIDPESLPIVKELREKLKNAEAERDAAIDCLHKCCTENGLCYGCKNWNRSECTDEDAKYFCDNGGSDMWEWSGLF